MKELQKQEQEWQWFAGRNTYCFMAVFLALAVIGTIKGLVIQNQKTKVVAAASPTPVQIEVRKGQVLSEIARGLGTSVKDLVELNQIANPNHIEKGQVLKVIPYNHTDVVEVSWYGPGFQGKLMANGRPFDMNDPTIVAHKYFSLGTRVRITNLTTGESIIVEVQDRGPYIKGRHFDLSMKAAKMLGIREAGHAFCKVEILG